MAKFSGLQAVTANLLCSGAAVYLTPYKTWSPRFGDAALFRTAEDVADAVAFGEAEVEARVVLDPYAFDCTQDGDRVAPKSVREVIRADGPSVARELNARSVGEAVA